MWLVEKKSTALYQENKLTWYPKNYFYLSLQITFTSIPIRFCKVISIDKWGVYIFLYVAYISKNKVVFFHLFSIRLISSRSIYFFLVFFPLWIPFFSTLLTANSTFHNFSSVERQHSAAAIFFPWLKKEMIFLYFPMLFFTYLDWFVLFVFIYGKGLKPLLLSVYFSTNGVCYLAVINCGTWRKIEIVFEKDNFLHSYVTLFIWDQLEQWFSTGAIPLPGKWLHDADG